MALSQNGYALIEAIRDVRRDPAMHQPLEDLQCTGHQRKWFVMVWLGRVPVLEDGDNVAELPGRGDHVPSEDQVEKREKRVVPPQQSGHCPVIDFNPPLPLPKTCPRVVGVGVSLLS